MTNQNIEKELNGFKNAIKQLEESLAERQQLLDKVSLEIEKTNQLVAEIEANLEKMKEETKQEPTINLDKKINLDEKIGAENLLDILF